MEDGRQAEEMETQECGAQQEDVAWIRKQAESGDAKAQFELGKCYAQGSGVEQSMSDAVEWYRKAAEKGHLRAKKELRNYYYNMAKKCKALLPNKVIETSMKLLMFLASAGALQLFDKPLVLLIAFVCVVGTCFIKPEGYRSTETYRIMMDYLRRAAELGHKRANIRILFWG